MKTMQATKEESIDVRDIITKIAVTDLQKSKDWYSRLFGKQPDLEPFPGNVEYKIGGGWIQIHTGKVQPSSWNLEIEVRDLSRERERIRHGSITATEISTAPNVISWFDVKDPDGNGIRLFQVLTSEPKVTGRD